MERLEFDRLLTANFAVIEASAKKYAMIYRLYHEWEDLLQTALLKMRRFADQYDNNKGALLPESRLNFILRVNIPPLCQ